MDQITINGQELSQSEVLTLKAALVSYKNIMTVVESTPEETYPEYVSIIPALTSDNAEFVQDLTSGYSTACSMMLDKFEPEVPSETSAEDIIQQ